MQNATDMELFLTIMKFAGLAISGFLGIVGTLTDTHEDILIPGPDGTEPRKGKRITIWGRRIVCLTVFGLLVALGAEIAQVVKEKGEKDETALRVLRQARATQRTLEVLQHIEFNQSPGLLTAVLSVPLTNAALAEELSWLKQLPARVATNWDASEVPGFPGIIVSGASTATNQNYAEPVEIAVYSDSPYHPFQQAQSRLSELLNRLIFDVRLLRPTNSSLDDESAHFVAQQLFAKSGDEIVDQTVVAFETSTLPGSVHLSFDLSNGNADLLFTQPFDVSSQNTSDIRKRLYGSIVRVSVDSEYVTGMKPVSAVFTNLIGTLALRDVAFTIGDKTIRSDNTAQVLLKFGIEDGAAVFYCVFDKNAIEFPEDRADK